MPIIREAIAMTINITAMSFVIPLLVRIRHLILVVQ